MEDNFNESLLPDKLCTPEQIDLIADQLALVLEQYLSRHGKKMTYQNLANSIYKYFSSSSDVIKANIRSWDGSKFDPDLDGDTRRFGRFIRKKGTLGSEGNLRCCASWLISPQNTLSNLTLNQYMGLEAAPKFVHMLDDHFVGKKGLRFKDVSSIVGSYQVITNFGAGQMMHTLELERTAESGFLKAQLSAVVGNSIHSSTWEKVSFSGWAIFSANSQLCILSRSEIDDSSHLHISINQHDQSRGVAFALGDTDIWLDEDVVELNNDVTSEKIYTIRFEKSARQYE